MKCPYCSNFQPNNKVRGYPVREQLHQHILVHHTIGNKPPQIIKV